VTVLDGGGAEKTGRTWTNSYSINQTAVAPELNYWVVNNTGYLYHVRLSDYNGINSIIQANSVGWPSDDCTPTYSSFENTVDGSNEPLPPLPDCGELYRVFFESPAGDLPQTAPSAQGTVNVLPSVLGPADLVVDDLAFQQDSLSANSGTFSYSITPRFSGSYQLQIDVDGNGSYDDPRDVVAQLGADGSGSYTYHFDGVDGEGNPITDCTQMHARLFFDKLGEIHVLQTDVEQRSGISITRENGAGAPNSTVYWDDSQMPGTRANGTPQTDGTAGVDSSTSVHGWAYSTNSWGNQRVIDDWTYLPAELGTGEISLSGRCLSIVKESTATADSRVGDTVTYTVTATNNGDLDYTADQPATVFDDLSGVLDDADYKGGAKASLGDAPAFVDPSFLRWSGALAAGQSVELTYTVTLKAGGDGVVRNVAWQPAVVPPTGQPPETVPACDITTEPGTDPTTGEPCAPENFQLPRLTIAKKADLSAISANGGVVTYTVTVTNEGPGDFSADAPGKATDDLSKVLDDGDYREDASATVGTVTFDGDHTLNWSGALTAKQSAVITYSVVYDSTAAEGDASLVNTACVPQNLALDPAAACANVEVPGARLTESKSVNPADGDSVVPGQSVEYTLTFSNTGGAPATVNTSDDLSGVLDDADIATGPTASAPGLTLGAVNANGVFTIVGTVPANSTTTVTYSVTVKDFADQGDHVLGNVLACDVSLPDCDPPATSNPVRHLVIDKVADPASGVDTSDTVTYTVTVHNDGAADYTAGDPAVVTDDMTDVLDDAMLDADSVDSESGKAAYDEAAKTLTWTGALASGASTSFSYTVTVTNVGNHSLVNAVTCDDDCAPVTVTVPLPHVVPAKASQPTSGEAVQAGQVITYTLTYVNDGQAAGTVDSTDDLSDVLDDAALTSRPVASDPAVTAVAADESLRVTGPIAAGATVTVVYQITVNPDGQRGNNVAGNVLMPDVPQLCGEEPCAPPTTEHPVGELIDWKSVDPASGTNVAPGQSVTYTLHFRSTGAAPVAIDREDDLTRVLDDATLTVDPAASDPSVSVSSVTDGRFAIHADALAPGQTVTVTYTVMVNPDGQRGDDQLGNFLVDPGEAPPATCEPSDDEMPDCTVNYVSYIVATKSVNPTSGTAVKDGQKVTYTLTFTNASTNPNADDSPVEYTDYLKDVLDDATVTTAPFSSAASVKATVSGETMAISGSLASGAAAQVTYTVTVKDYAKQGNHRLGNILAVTGGDPICAPGSKLCTENGITPPTPGLASTGSSLSPAALLGALVALLAGAAIALIRRRRNATENRR
jgi:fimbrial isopeptide formation D2 family protein/uncharacterized repeat protein (TIGR01451 family)/LPXTG-motif cell wall-anchored protein